MEHVVKNKAGFLKTAKGAALAYTAGVVGFPTIILSETGDRLENSTHNPIQALGLIFNDISGVGKRVMGTLECRISGPIHYQFATVGFGTLPVLAIACIGALAVENLKTTAPQNVVDFEGACTGADITTDKDGNKQMILPSGCTLTYKP